MDKNFINNDYHEYTDNKEFISEKDINKLKFEKYKKHIEKLQEKEQFVMSLPYEEDAPMLFLLIL